MPVRSHNQVFEAAQTDLEEMHGGYPIHAFNKSIYGLLDIVSDNYLVKSSSAMPNVFDETATPKTQLGSYVHDLIATRKLTHTPEAIDLRISEFCDIAEPTMLTALDQADTPRSRPLIFVHDTDDQPIAVIKNKGDATAFALQDNRRFVLGESGIYSMTFGPLDTIKTSVPHIKRIKLGKIESLKPGRISVFAGSDDDRAKYRPERLHKWTATKRDKIPKQVLKDLPAVSHYELVRRAEELSESIR